jgi:hypothetical protein
MSIGSCNHSSKEWTVNHRHINRITMTSRTSQSNKVIRQLSSCHEWLNWMNYCLFNVWYIYIYIYFSKLLLLKKQRSSITHLWRISCFQICRNMWQWWTRTYCIIVRLLMYDSLFYVFKIQVLHVNNSYMIIVVFFFQTNSYRLSTKIIQSVATQHDVKKRNRFRKTRTIHRQL